jgi:catechol 2,3-dioxygenase-like lactoylglutathione lyase family enzyme
MLNSVDRILVAVRDLDQAEENYREVLGAQYLDELVSDHLNARGRRLVIGESTVELWTPQGAGPVSDHLESFGEGLFFGGVSTASLSEYQRLLAEQGIRFAEADGRLYLGTEDLYGMPLVVSEAAPRVRANGPVSFLYELTMVLRTDWREVADCYARKLGLQRDKAVDITFARFGYEGTLLMFAPDLLDRIELAEAHDPKFAMGRFSGKRGDALYMCYIETDDLPDVIRRLEARKEKWTRRTDTGKPEQDGLWIHPSALNGVLLGVSRTSLAWGWSGSPEKVQEISGEQS